MPTGSDCVSAFFLKAVACEIAEPLALIFNKSLDTGLVPSAWKYCNVTPIYKGGDKADPSNFRPISAVPVAVAKHFLKGDWCIELCDTIDTTRYRDAN